MEPETLSDEQTDLLLRNAEARLSGRLPGQDVNSISNVQVGQAEISVRYELSHVLFLSHDICV